MIKKYLEIQKNDDIRFWQIEQEGNQTSVCYGKVGSKGRTLSKEFDSEEAALADAEKQVAGKLKQDYQEADSTAQEAAETSRAAAAKAAKAIEDAGKAPKAETSQLASYRDDHFAVSSDINALCYHPDGDSLLCTYGGGWRRWDVQSGEIQPAKGKGGHGRLLRLIEGSDELYLFGDSLSILSQQGESVASYIWNGKVGSTTRFAGHATQERAFLAANTREYHRDRPEGLQTECHAYLHRWDRTNHQELAPITLTLGEDTYSHTGVFSPDGKLFAYGTSGAMPLHFLDTESGKLLHTLDVNVTSHGMAFSPDSKRLAHFATGDGLTIYDAHTGEKQQEWRRWEFHSSITGVQFSPDGQKVLVQFAGREVCWDPSKAETELWVACDAYSGGALAYSPDSKTLAVAHNRKVAFRDAETGALHELREAPSEPYTALHVDPESGHLFAFTPGVLANSHIFDAKLQYKQAFRGLGFSHCPGIRRFLVHMGVGLGMMDPERLTLTPVHPMHSSTIAMGPDFFAATQREASGSWWRSGDEKWVRTWSLGGHRRRTIHDDKKTCPTGSMCISPDGQYLYATRGKNFMVWNLETEELLHDTKEGSHATEQMAISPDGKWLATCDKHRNVRLWDALDFKVIHSQKAPASVLKMEFSWDSKRLFLGSPGDATTWDVETASPIASLPLPKGLMASAMTLGHNAILYVAGHDRSLHSFDASSLWAPKPLEAPPSFLALQDIAAKTPLAKLEKTLQGAAWEHFDPLRDTVLLRRLLQEIEKKHGIVQLHHDCTHQVLRHSRRLLHQFGHRTPPIDQDTSPCGRWLATGSWVGENYEEGGELQIWERETGRCVNTFTHIDGGVGWPDYGCMEWSPDSTQLGMAYCTNVVGNFLPFSSGNYPMTSISVTDGGNRPPGMSWTPDGQGMYVHAWKTCIAPLDRNAVSEYQVHWFEEEDPPAHLIAKYSGHIDNGPAYGDTKAPVPAEFAPSTYLHFPTGMTLPHLTQSPLVVTGRDLGNRYPVNPAFPLRKGRKWYWAVAFDTGLVLCPEDAQELLEAELSFSIENRFSWPVRWADHRDYYVTSSISEAVEHPLMSLNAQDRKSLNRPQPASTIEYFTTHQAADLEYYNDYRDTISVEEYQLNTQEAHAYGAEPLFEGEQINADNIRPLLGKCVLYAETYSPERVKVGALLGVSDEGATIYSRAVSGGSSSIGNQGFSYLVFVGEAITAEAEAPTVEMPEDFNPEAGLRAQFPCGKNLAQLTNPDVNATGELIIPLPFEGDDQLTVRWEKLPDFEVDRDFAWEWGHRLLDERTGIHCLGKFYYNGEELEPVGEAHEAEYFYKSRIDGHGNADEGSSEEFDGTHGFNVSLLMRMVPKKKGQFNAEAPVEEILAAQFGWKGSYQLNWIPQGGSQWILRVYDEKIFSDEDVNAVTEEHFYIDFFEGTVRWEHRFTPTDNFNT